MYGILYIRTNPNSTHRKLVFGVVFSSGGNVDQIVRAIHGNARIGCDLRNNSLGRFGGKHKCVADIVEHKHSIRQPVFKCRIQINVNPNNTCIRLEGHSARWQKRKWSAYSSDVPENRTQRTATRETKPRINKTLCAGALLSKTRLSVFTHTHTHILGPNERTNGSEDKNKTNLRCRRADM